MSSNRLNDFSNFGCLEEALSEAKQYEEQPLVLVSCITYNQEKYIAQCLDGVVMQKTTFRFLAIIHDDASSDNTSKILQEYAQKYPDIIKPIYDSVNRHNEGTLGKVMDLFVNAYNPKYIAVCEGDDYWTDDRKLEKQVAYMEIHPECVMCHTDFDTSDRQKIKTQKHFDDEAYFGPGHIHSYHIATLTTLYRKDVYDRTPHCAQNKKWLMGDKPLWIELSREGKFHYMSDVTAMYRVLPNSASHSTDEKKIIAFWESSNEIERFYSNLYGFEYDYPNKKTLYHTIIKQSFNNHDKKMAKKYWIKACREKNTSIKMFLFYLCNIYNANWLIKLLYKLC